MKPFVAAVAVLVALVVGVQAQTFIVDAQRALAEQGDAGAQYNLGVMLSDGRGAHQDYTEAVRWFRLAAEQGHILAKYNLGRRYYFDNGVRPVGPQRFAQLPGLLAVEHNVPDARRQ